MKRHVVFLLTALLILCLVACQAENTEEIGSVSEVHNDHAGMHLMRNRKKPQTRQMHFPPDASVTRWLLPLQTP